MQNQAIFPLLISILFLSKPAFSLPSSPAIPNSALQTAYEFPKNTWIENLAVRGSGKVLVTLLSTPEVWQIDPVTHTAELIYHFPNTTGTSGITEIEGDVFAVAVGNWSDITFSSTPGSYSIWSIDLSGITAQVHKITDIPEAQFLNGMTTLPTKKNIVLVGDADAGVIWGVDTKTGVYRVVIDNPDFKPNASSAVELGINGIRYLDGYVYFVNTFNTPLYSRIPVSTDGSASGPVEAISSNFTTPDDFALDHHGNAWIATDPSNTIIKVTRDGGVKVIVGGVQETSLLGPTSAAFGRTCDDLDILYVTTNGGIGNPPSTGIEPGRLYSIDTSKF